MQRFSRPRFLLHAKRKTTTIAIIPRNSFPASPSPQKICKLKENITDPCITQGTLDHLKWAISGWSEIPVKHYAPQGNVAFGNTHPPVKCYSDDHIWLQRQWYVPDGKNQAQVSNGDLKSEMTCYVIDADTSYNLLLGRHWIHRNAIVPSTLHQVMKYVDEDGK